MRIKPSYKIALAALVLAAGCQKNDLDNGQVFNDGTIKYAVTVGQSDVTDSPTSKAVQTAGQGDTGNVITLTDKSGKIFIPMVCEVTDGIFCATAAANDTQDVTKGTRINTSGSDEALSEFAEAIGDKFVVKAYDGTTEKLSQTVNWSGSAWVGDPVAYWPQAKNLNFLAYANLPGSQTATITSAGVSTTHTVPAEVTAQTDILFGRYKGNGSNTGTAKIRFEHPLTAVQFKYGEIIDDLKVKSISLEGVAASGTATMSQTGSISWSGVSTYDETVSQSNDSGLPVDETSKVIGEPFLLIPQTLSEKNVSLSIIFTNGDIAIGTLNTGEWEMGKTNSYTLGFDPCTYIYNFELETAADASKSFFNTTNPETNAINIVSKKIRDYSVETPAEWVIKSVQVGTADSQSVNATSFENIGGLSATQTDGGTKLSITAAERILVNPSTHDYWVNQNPVREENLDWSPADWSETKATASNPLDLSKFNFQTETTDNPMTTANCYVIRHAGTYKLPLVYGNAVVNGAVNEQSYFPNVTGGEYRLERFQNCFGNGITSAFIENDGNCGGEYLRCAVIWQDKAEVVTNIHLSSDAADEGFVYDKDNVRYLVFDVPQGSICQNNALICIYKDKVGGTTGEYDPGEAVWSWHIWTTNDPALLSPAIPVFNHGYVEYDFFPLYALGWLDADKYLAKEDVKIVLAQKESGKEITISVKQNAVAVSASNGTYYQFGRKDPMCTTDSPAKGTFNINVGPVTLAGAICNPGNFYIKSFNWCSTSYHNLWTGKKSTTDMFDQNADIIKTIYDPSPVGYKIPVTKAFTGFTTTGDNTGTPSEFNVDGSFNNGWYFYTKPEKQGNTVYLPASGQRYFYIDGIIDVVGILGKFWSAEPYDAIYGRYIVIASNNIWTDISCDRANGFSVRPVTEPKTTNANSQDYSGHEL